MRNKTIPGSQYLTKKKKKKKKKKKIYCMAKFILGTMQGGY